MSYKGGGGQGFIGFVEGGGVLREEGGNFGDGGAEVIIPELRLIAFNAKFGADVGAFGPFPEFGFVLFAGFGLEHAEAPLFEFEAASAEVAAAEGDDVSGEMAEAAEVGFGVIVFDRGEGMGGGSEADGEPLDEFIGEVMAGRLRREGVGGVEGGEGESVLAHLPVAEAMLGPFVEVLFRDGFGTELRAEEGLDLGEGIEPGAEVVLGFAFVEAAVELVADGLGEASDFAVHNFSFWFERSRETWTKTVQV
jgi:hypothetical protein